MNNNNREEELKWRSSRVKGSNKPRFKSKSSYSYKTFQKPRKNAKNSNHVMVKITSKSKFAIHSKMHLDYISRHKSLTIYDEFLSTYTNDEAQQIANYYLSKDKFSHSDSAKTYNMVFSMKGENNTEKMLEAVAESVKNEYPDNKFFLCAHTDTGNTHIHLMLVRKTKTGKKTRCEIRKNNLNKIKKGYAEALVQRGIDAKFLSEHDKQKLNPNRKERITNTYQLLDYGNANYQFDTNNPKSFFLQYATHNGVIKTSWSKAFYSQLKDKEIKKGDIVKIKKSDGKWEVEKTEEHKEAFEKKTCQLVDFGIDNYKHDANSKRAHFVILKDEKGEIKEVWDKQVYEHIKQSNLKRTDIVEYTPSTNFVQKQTLEQKQTLNIKAGKKL